MFGYFSVSPDCFLCDISEFLCCCPVNILALHAHAYTHPSPNIPHLILSSVSLNHPSAKKLWDPLMSVRVDNIICSQHDESSRHQLEDNRIHLWETVGNYHLGPMTNIFLIIALYPGNTFNLEYDDTVLPKKGSVETILVHTPTSHLRPHPAILMVLGYCRFYLMTFSAVNNILQHGF